MDLNNLEAEDERATASTVKVPYAAVLRARMLDGEEIIILKDRTKLKELKKSDPDKVIYLPSEIEKLEPFRGDKSAIRAVHAAKKKFAGWLY